MGIFSTFNDDIMERAMLHKGPVPSCFGVPHHLFLKTYMKSGDMEGYHFSGTVGILNAKVSG